MRALDDREIPITVRLKPGVTWNAALDLALGTVNLRAVGQTGSVLRVVTSRGNLRTTLGLDLDVAWQTGAYLLQGSQLPAALRPLLYDIEGPIPAYLQRDDGTSPYPSGTPGESVFQSNLRTYAPSRRGGAAMPDGTGVRVTIVDTGATQRFTLVQPATANGRVTLPGRVLKVLGVWTDTSRVQEVRYRVADPTQPGHLEVEGQGRVHVEWTGVHPAFGNADVPTLRTAGGELNPHQDPVGHGTAVWAHLHAVAPGAQVTMVKFADRGFRNYPLAGLMVALERPPGVPAPHIVLCSWVMHSASRHLQTLIEEADDVLIVAASGNGPMSDRNRFGIPISHPDVLSVGGARVRKKVRASNYAASFASGVHHRRTCPDVVGPAGSCPKDFPYVVADGLMTPTEPGSEMDQKPVGTQWRPRDHAQDGWFEASGTSFAAAQVAGVAACLTQVALERDMPRRPDRMIELLKRTAQDVERGRTFPKDRARPGTDRATGAGLVRLAAAVDLLDTHTPTRGAQDAVVS